MKFGEFLKRSRIQARLTLRDCAGKLGVDPSNWSKLERNISPAPKDASIIDKWADFLGVPSADRQHLLDAASLSRKEIPMDVATDERAIAALPVFFRAVRGKELEGERLDAFIQDLKEAYSPTTDL